jgi:transcriptional regulator with XRE-family HTH domain
MENQDLKKKLGQGLRALRTKKGLTQEDLEKFGISHRYYRRIEGGKVNPTVDTLARLCQAFDSTVPELFSLIEPPLSPEGQSVSVKVAEILRSGDGAKIRKLNLILDEVL